MFTINAQPCKMQNGTTG